MQPAREREPASAANALNILLGSAIVMLLAAIVLSFLVTTIASSAALSSHIFWYLGRAAGLVAYWLLFSSVALGLVITSRAFRGLLGRPWVFEIHKFLSLVVLGFMAFHIFIMLPDQFIGFRLDELLLPFRSHYRPVALTLGGLTFYGSILLTASFYVRRFIGHRSWRALHYLSFLLYVLAILHALLTGSDSGNSLVQLSYFVSGLVVLLLLAERILNPQPPSLRPLASDTAAAR